MVIVIVIVIVGILLAHPLPASELRRPATAPADQPGIERESMADAFRKEEPSEVRRLGKRLQPRTAECARRAGWFELDPSVVCTNSNRSCSMFTTT